MNQYIPKPKLIRQSNNNYIPRTGSKWTEDKSKLSIIIVRIQFIENIYKVIYKYISKTNNTGEQMLTLSEFHSNFSNGKN